MVRRSKDIARGLSKTFGFPTFTLDHLAKVMSHSYLDAPISNQEETYPVVVISHGWRGFRNLHTDVAEELASNGYVVVSIDHTYGSVATVFDQNDVAYLNPDALPSREGNNDFLDYANQLVTTYGNDVETTLNFLETTNTNDNYKYYGKLDLDHIGVIGHSTGGGGDVSAALQDDRISALIGLDAWVEPIDSNQIDQGLTIPSLFLRSGEWEEGENNENLYRLIDQSAYPSNLYQIDGTIHYDFTMVYMFSPISSLVGFTGSVNSMYLQHMLEEIILQFFNQTLVEQSGNIVDMSSWPEIRKIETE